MWIIYEHIKCWFLCHNYHELVICLFVLSLQGAGRKELESLFSGIFINDQIGMVYIKEIYG